MKANNSNFNVAIIGFGKIGRIRYNVLKKKKFINKIYIYDLYKKNIHLRNFKNLDEIFKDKTVNSIFICTPNYLNAKFTIEALQNKKNVFCEKPPSLNSRELLKVIAAKKKNNKILVYGFNHRFHESIIKIKKIIDSKILGRILWIRGRYGKSVNKDFYKDWRAQKKFSGGGILIDQGIHMLDLYLLFVGSFNKVHALVSNLYWKCNIEDNVFVNLENTKKKIAASFHSTMTQWRHLFSIEIFFQKGNIILNGLITPSKNYGAEVLTISSKRNTHPVAMWNKEKVYKYKIDKSWSNEIDNFFDLVFKKNKNNNDLNEAYKLMKLIDKIYSFKKY